MIRQFNNKPFHWKNGIASLFLIIMLFAFYKFLLNAKGFDQKSITTYFNNIYNRSKIIDLYGASQKILNKKAIENFSIFKNNYGKLTKPYNEMALDSIKSNIKKIKPIFEYCNEKELPCYYITSLLPIVDTGDLPYEKIDYSHENAIALERELEKNDISIINLRSNMEIADISKYNLFYKTDHHWQTKTTFAAFQVVISYIKDVVTTDVTWTDPSLYNEKKYENSFLGSYGIKVGQHYAGRDDFTILIPKELGAFSFEAYDAKGNLILENEGDWLSALTNVKILEDDKYNNKYNAWQNSCYIENRNINLMAKNTTKLLLIAHSYGFPLSQYFSLCFKEVRQLDPQKGRFVGNYLDYIDEYQPDIVLFLTEFEGDLIGEYNTEK